jgi:Immunity protein Imm1
LSADRYPNRDEEIDQPTWPQIEAEIRALDNSRHTPVTIAYDVEHWMGLGAGGGGGRYFVTTHEGDGADYIAVTPEAPSTVLVLVVGGQDTGYTMRETVDLEAALRAAAAYAADGTRNTTLTWDGPRPGTPN